jgi:phosphopantothenoylcysteine decarboxylase / phosphopantothenate---cysteine ligase
MKYVLAVTGSIASFKSYEVARQLVKNGYEVKVILTQGALEFIKPDTFRYLGVQDVYLPTDDFDPKNLGQKENVLHIELAKWAHKLIIAPASANTMARLALGLNNDLLGSLFLAFGKRPVLIFPAMNTEMWNHPRTQEHLSSLRNLSHISVVNPVSGLLACGDIGQGKFPEVSAVVDLIETLDPHKKSGKKIVITAGATVSPLDPVRYLTNPSSGKMGVAIAKAFLEAGHEVTVLAGYQCTSQVDNLLGHPAFQLVRTPTTQQMRDAALKHFSDADLYISTGAIADVEFDIAKEKIKKESMGTSLPFRQGPDILKDILSLRKHHQRVISFAAETQTTEEVFREKMSRKPVDLMIGNKVSSGILGDNTVTGFQVDEGHYYFVEPGKTTGPLPLKKIELGYKLSQWFEGKTSW